MSLDAETIKKLRELAEAATPGPWSVNENTGMDEAWCDWHNVGPLSFMGGKLNANTTYVAAANPAVILSLIDALETQSSRTEAMRKALEPFKSGGNWGRYKAWLTCGPPTQADGVRAAKQITEWQVAVDRAALEGRTDA